MSEIMKFKKGDIIVQEGTVGSLAYIITSGMVEVYRTVKGKKVPLAVLGAGNIVGEMELITNMPRTSTIAALEDVVATAVNRETFESMIIGDPDMVMQLLTQVCHRLSHMNQLVMALYEKSGDSELEMQNQKVLRLQAVTKEAEAAMGKKEAFVAKTPFFIGRAEGHGPIDSRDLSLKDREPFQISRNHCVIALFKEQYHVVDSNSTMGTEVDGIRIGKKETRKNIPLKEGAHRVVLGGPGSHYVFELKVP
jgi:CRP-like cAMP-binding protein